MNVSKLLLLLPTPFCLVACALPWGLGVAEPVVECDANGCAISVGIRPVEGASPPPPVETPAVVR